MGNDQPKASVKASRPTESNKTRNLINLRTIRMIEFTRMDRVQLLFTLQVFTLINNIFTLINNIRISIKRESFLKAQKMVSSPPPVIGG